MIKRAWYKGIRQSYTLMDTWFVTSKMIVGGKTNRQVTITTDTHMKFIKAFELYQIRWNIKVMFRECHLYLRLESCQDTDFDTQTADNTLCMMIHLLIMLGKQFSKYEPMGELFRPKESRC